jgi:hypothetical protein
MIEPSRRAGLDPVASAIRSVVVGGAADDCRAVDVRVLGGIELRVLPDRGLDVGGAWFRGVPIAWISAIGECAPLPEEELRERRWLDCYGGGLVTTCGLCNVGEPSESHGLNGTFTGRAAEEVHAEPSERDVTVTGVVVDPPFRLSRRIVTAVGTGAVRIDDRVVNESEWTAAAPMLYRVALGAPVWNDGSWIETDGVEPESPASNGSTSGWDEAPEPAAGAPERVFEHAGATWVRVTSPRAGLELTVRSSLPRLWQRLQPATGTYALFLEPANCSLLGREADIETGQMPFLDPGESRHSWLTFEVRSIA